MSKSLKSLCLTLVILFQCTYVYSDEGVSPRTLDEVQYTVINDTQFNLSVIRKNVEWGRWVKTPAHDIPPYSKDIFSTRGTIFAGTEGNVEYSIYDGSFDIYWSLSHWGSASNNLVVNDPHHKYNIFHERTGDMHTVYVKEKVAPKKYDILIMSDPQAWRLNINGNNPNKDKSAWEYSNNNTALSLQSLESKKNFAFGIINGDITEFGRMETRRSFDDVYSSSLKTKLLIGLGNHDYANNVSDCTEPNNLDFSTNACARGAFFDLIKRMNQYKSFLDNFSSDYSDATKTGSGSYSWDKGDIHYVQLQNYPTYNVELGHYASETIHIKKSLDWLESDLKSAFARGKATVLNYHDDYDHFRSETTSEEKIRIERMIKENNVIAIFSGHSHSAGKSYSGFINGVMHYNSGALFQGDYFSVSVKGKCIDTSLYNGKSGVPVLISEYGIVCGEN